MLLGQDLIGWRRISLPAENRCEKIQPGHLDWLAGAFRVLPNVCYQNGNLSINRLYHPYMARAQWQKWRSFPDGLFLSSLREIMAGLGCIC